jgi:hypothetical protein
MPGLHKWLCKEIKRETHTERDRDRDRKVEDRQKERKRHTYIVQMYRCIEW